MFSDFGFFVEMQAFIGLAILISVRFFIHSLFAQIAQLVEQGTENPRVTGSIPVLGIFLFTGK